MKKLYVASVTIYALVYAESIDEARTVLMYERAFWNEVGEHDLSEEATISLTSLKDPRLWPEGWEENCCPWGGDGATLGDLRRGLPS